MTDNQTAMLEWVGRIQYPKLKAIYAGTLFIEASAKDHEVREEFMKLFLQYLPEGFEIKEMIRGTIWFVPAKENM